MASRIAGITVEIGGDTTKLSKALESVNKTIKTTQSELKDVNKLLKLDPSNTEAVTQKQRMLKEAIEATKEKLTTLKTAAEQANQQLADGKITQDQYDALQREIVETEQNLKSLQEQAAVTNTTLAKIDAVGEKLQTVGSQVEGVGKKFLPVTAAVTGLGTAAVKTAADFDQEMSKVAAISGATGSDFDSLREKAREMGAKTKFSASEAASAMEYMAMAGWKTGDMLDGIEGIMNLAAASGEDLATTSDIVTDALTAFGLSAADSGHFADILATASSNANTNVSMMGETFKYCAPIAGALGFSAEDTAEAIGLMANSGIKASQAGTSLRSIMNNLAGEVTFAGKNIGGVTIATSNADGSMRSLNDILADCRVAFSGLTESEKAANAESLVGKNAMSGFLALMNAGEGDIDKLRGAIENCDGSAESMAETMQDNLNGQLTILKSQLEELAISFGDLLMPTIRKIVSAVQAFVDKLNSMDDSTRETILKVAALAAAIGPLLIVLGKTISTVGTALREFSSLAKGIQSTASTAWEGIKSGISSAWEGISGFFGGIWDAITGKSSDSTTQMKTDTSNAWSGVEAEAQTAWSGVSTSVSTACTGMAQSVTTQIDSIKASMSAAWSGIASDTTTAWNAVNPCLYASMETKFDNNGIGKLVDAQSCIVTEKRNGSFELEMVYPADGIHADQLEEGHIILAKPSDTGRPQPFRIYKIATPIDGKLTVKARHISYQLNFITVSPFATTGCTGALAGLENHAASECPFEVWTDISSSASFRLSVPSSFRNCLGGIDGSVLDTFGGEYEWDRYTIKLHHHRGADHGVHIVYGKNLIDFKMEKNIESVITGVHPYWQNSETGEVTELPEKVVLVEQRSVPYQKITVLDCTSGFQDKPTDEMMRSFAQDYLKNTSLTEPQVDIDIDFIQLWNTPDYEDVVEAEQVSLCDTVHVFISKLGIEVSSKVTETQYDCLLERYEGITLSNSTVSSRNSSLTTALSSIRNTANEAYNTALRVETSMGEQIGGISVSMVYDGTLLTGLFGLHYIAQMNALASGHFIADTFL